MLKEEMPPGWKKAVNSSTLTSSFTFVDKYKWKKGKSEMVTENETSSLDVADVVIDVLSKLDDEKQYSEAQLANILIKLKSLVKSGSKYKGSLQKSKYIYITYRQAWVPVLPSQPYLR